jgi:hypothetical protein
MITYYQILGLDEDAGDEKIRARYLELVREFTPEKSPEQFMRITRAYEGIRDRQSRIRSRITGLRTYRFWTDALDDLVAGIPVERKSPGLKDMLEAQKND